MNFQFFCPRWGSEHLRWNVFLKKVKDAGYQGVEYAIAASVTRKELDEIWNLALKNDLLLIAQHYDTNGKDFNEHYNTYAEWFKKINPYPWHKINSQTGKDFFSFDQNCQLIELGNSYGALHETHRGKFSFAAHITKIFLEKIPDIRLTLDVSHWVCVAESLLEDQPVAMNFAIERTEHIHARVGYPEGPQVTDPRISESKIALDRHLFWWDQVAARKKDANKILTITPEFGTFPYMVHLPATGQPITDQWEVNRFMMELLGTRYC